jgi:hypothetical protein
MPVSSIRLSDRLHQLAHGSGPKCTSRRAGARSSRNTVLAVARQRAGPGVKMVICIGASSGFGLRRNPHPHAAGVRPRRLFFVCRASSSQERSIHSDSLRRSSRWSGSSRTLLAQILAPFRICTRCMSYDVTPNCRENSHQQNALILNTPIALAICLKRAKRKLGDQAPRKVQKFDLCDFPPVVKSLARGPAAILTKCARPSTPSDCY